MPDFFWFSDTQWARIAPLLPTDMRGMARVDDRRVLMSIATENFPLLSIENFSL